MRSQVYARGGVQRCVEGRVAHNCCVCVALLGVFYVLEVHEGSLLATDNNSVFKALERHSSLQFLSSKVKNYCRDEDRDDENDDGQHHRIGGREGLALEDAWQSCVCVCVCVCVCQSNDRRYTEGAVSSRVRYARRSTWQEAW
jgi:hypothetical protein